MSEASTRRGPWSRLAPLAFVAGLVLLGLAILVAALAATGSDLPVGAEPEEFSVNGTAHLVYPVSVGARGDDRLTVHFRFPEDAGTGMVVRCGDHQRLRAGEAPLEPQVVTAGRSGSFSTTLSGSFLGGSTRDAYCPFLYVVLQWPAGEGDAARNRPLVTMVRESVLLEGPVGAFVGITGVLGAGLATTFGVAWGRRLNRAARVEAAGLEESAAETLLLTLERSGRWMERTRRYLFLGGVFGIFLWYPIILPWTFRYALDGTAVAPLPWVVSAAILGLLVALTLVWAREYLRLDRELHAWEVRIARLREREAALLSELERG